MNLYRPAYLAFITETIPTIHPHSTTTTPQTTTTPHTNPQTTKISLEKPYTWKRSEDLMPGDVFVNKRGKYVAEIWQVFLDADGVWVEDIQTEGYLDYGKWFRVER